MERDSVPLTETVEVDSTSKGRNVAVTSVETSIRQNSDNELEEEEEDENGESDNNWYELLQSPTDIAACSPSLPIVKGSSPDQLHHGIGKFILWLLNTLAVVGVSVSFFLNMPSHANFSLLFV